MFTILGAGLSGLSASFHLGHVRCRMYEAKPYAGGHIYSHKVNGFVWDEGPHVSFTKHQYVKSLFENSVESELLEYPVFPTNYYKGSWVPHPAQSNLYALPSPLREQCLEDFLASRKDKNENDAPVNYQEWLEEAFGKTFTQAFPAAYTKKYWTVSPEGLGTSWVGNRVFYPDIETVKKGFEGPLESSTHYITSVRYPKKGGYIRFADSLLQHANIEYNKQVVRIDLNEKCISFEDGSIVNYEKLISTIPLPEFVMYCAPPPEIEEAASLLACSQLLLVNVEVDHLPVRSEHWMYVYDEDKFSTRINFTDLLSPNNAPDGKCGIQVEVYFSKNKPKIFDDSYYVQAVIAELLDMGLIENEESVNGHHTQYIKYANVICDHNYESALNIILTWLSENGLEREDDDLHPMSNWDDKFKSDFRAGDLAMAGRFGQWKYFWTDDCVLRGKFIAQKYG